MDVGLISDVNEQFVRDHRQYGYASRAHLADDALTMFREALRKKAEENRKSRVNVAEPGGRRVESDAP